MLFLWGEEGEGELYFQQYYLSHKYIQPLTVKLLGKNAFEREGTLGRTAAEREKGVIFGPWFSNGHRLIWALLGEKRRKEGKNFKWITLPPILI